MRIGGNDSRGREALRYLLRLQAVLRRESERGSREASGAAAECATRVVRSGVCANDSANERASSGTGEVDRELLINKVYQQVFCRKFANTPVA